VQFAQSIFCRFWLVKFSFKIFSSISLVFTSDSLLQTHVLLYSLSVVCCKGILRFPLNDDVVYPADRGSTFHQRLVNFYQTKRGQIPNYTAIFITEVVRISL